MAQIFHPSTNVISRASIVGLFVIAPTIIFAAGVGISRSPYNTKVGVPAEQPIPFSHEHHARELGIDCRYCHTSVETSATASLPPTQTCMSCHSQIWTNSPLLEPIRQSYATNTPIVWNQLNKTPDFVYFNHSIHVARGINCNVCHGPIQKMMLTAKGETFHMKWCLDCHRNPGAAIYKDPHPSRPGETPREQVFDLYAKYQSEPDKLSARERAIADGAPYTPTAEEQAQGDKLVGEYHVKKKQLTDCWVCHR